MATAIKKPVSVPDRKKQAKVLDFEPQRLRAPFFLRCAAVAIDYLLFIAAPVLWLLISRPLSDTGATASIASAAWLIGTVISILNIMVLPLWRGQSVGKLLTGLTILKLDGTEVDMVTLLKRNLLGYFVTLITFGLGFLMSAINSSGRSLHDLIAGTIVVRGRKTLV